MEFYGYAHHSYAVGVTLLLAVILVSACSGNFPSGNPASIESIVSQMAAPTLTPGPVTQTPIAGLVGPTTSTPSALKSVQGSATTSSPIAPAFKANSGTGSGSTSMAVTPVGPTATVTLLAATSEWAQSNRPIPDSVDPVTPAAVDAATPASIPTRPGTVVPPDASPSPIAGNDHQAGVDVYETTVSLPTYPFKEHLVERIDPVYNMPVLYLNRAEYEAANPTPAPVDYQGIVLENPYVRLIFIPELGGRLYSATIKATDQELFYHNPVVKPSRYGVLEPYEANWWLATGGMEWAYPTQEHGYRFGVPWDYTVAQRSESATITLSDLERGRVGLEVSVTLLANSPVFTVAPRLVNDGTASAPIQLWTNAALTLAPDSMSPDTQFIIPTDVITVHSRGEAAWTVPDGEHEAPWPQVDDTDLSDYSQWANYLGFFVSNTEAPFVGAYNEAADLGIVRQATTDSPTGSGKVFAFGKDFPDRSYTDNESQYFEIWGGANAGFWPEFDILVPVDETLTWQESWWPISNLGGITWATEDIAIYLTDAADGYTLSALVSKPRQLKLQVSSAEGKILEDQFFADPARPLAWEFVAGPEPVSIEFLDTNNIALLQYRIK